MSDLHARIRNLKQDWLECCDELLPLHPAGHVWRYSREMGRKDPREGWKIHVSATIMNAVRVLSRIGPVLRSSGVAFKGPATLDDLRRINSGILYGYSQVGKFVTVYPRTDAEFTLLCKSLDGLTEPLGKGPRVPFDSALRDGSNIYYRYGPFKDPSNSLDVYSPSGPTAPAGFNGLATALEKPVHRPSPLADRFCVFRAIRQRGRGGVYEAIDIGSETPRHRMVKEGRRFGEVSWDGRDGYDRIVNEESVLRELGRKIAALPRLIDSFDADGDRYLVFEKIDGIDLQKMIDRTGGPLALELARHLSRELAQLLACIHHAGFVWRDCKPSNLFIERSGNLRAIDLESAARIDRFDPIVWSTPDYSPPETSAGIFTTECGSNAGEDNFALGCCIFLFYEGRLPFMGSDRHHPLPMEHCGDKNLRSTIYRLLDPDPRSRPSASELLRSFERSA